MQRIKNPDNWLMALAKEKPLTDQIKLSVREKKILDQALSIMERGAKLFDGLYHTQDEPAENPFFVAEVELKGVLNETS